MLLRYSPVAREEITTVVKDANVGTSCIGSSNPELQGLSAADGWNKSIKRKRSAPSVGIRNLDGSRGTKQVLQQSNAHDLRSRSLDGLGFRTNIQDDALIEYQSHPTKGKASRTPRSASGSLSTGFSCLPRTHAGLDKWNDTQRQSQVAPDSHKCPVPIGSPLPVISQWKGQRRQKSARTRRMNVMPPVSSHGNLQFLAEAVPPSGSAAGVTSKEELTDASGLILCKDISSNSQLSLIAPNSLSPAILVESEFVSAENIRKEELTDNCKAITVSAMPKLEPVTSIEKSKAHDGLGDSVRVLQKNGKGSSLLKSCISSKENVEVPEMTKQIRGGKVDSNKIESKAGCPSSRRAVDRNMHAMNSYSQFTGDQGDGHEELVAAAAYAHYCSSTHCFQCRKDITSDSFWDRMRPFFEFVTSDKIAHLKDLIKLAVDMDGEIDACNKNGVVSQELRQKPSIARRKRNQMNTPKQSKHLGILCSNDVHQSATEGLELETSEYLGVNIPLSQRLLAAIIPEDETENCSYNVEENLYSKVARDYLDGLGGSAKDSNWLGMGHGKFFPFPSQDCFREGSFSTGITIPSNVQDAVVSGLKPCKGLLLGDFTVPHSGISTHPLCMQNDMSEVQNHMSLDFSELPPSDCLYENMSLDDRILLELQSIGIYLDEVLDLDDGDEDIAKDISELKSRLYEKMEKNKARLCNLDQEIQKLRAFEERNLEQVAMGKLVELAFGRLMGGQGVHCSTYKGSRVNKFYKQAAFTFAKRVLAECQKFEDTGKSCFSEPPYRDVLFSALCSESKDHSDHDCLPQALRQILSFPGTFSSIKTHDRSISVGSKFCDNSLLKGFVRTPELSPKNETILDRGSKREFLHDQVVAAVSPFGTMVAGCAKGRSARDRDRKKDTSTRSSTKSGHRLPRPTKGERRIKSRAKQKVTQPTNNGTDPNNSIGGQAALPALHLPEAGKSEDKVHGTDPVHPNNSAIELSNEIENLDLPDLPLHVSDKFVSQAHDISTWLNVDEDSLQDLEMVGLEIPMDDLSELDMNAILL